MSSHHFLTRIRLLSGACVLVTLLLFAKLYVVQIVHGSEYSDKADRQYARPSQDLFDRGSIFFTSKDGSVVSAANLKGGFLLSLVPKYITDPEGTYEKLSEYIDLDRDSFLLKAKKANDPYEEVANEVPASVADSITKLKLPGVSLYKERWRSYPGENLASHVLGFVGFSGDKEGGQYGLERYYEDILSRKGGGLYKNFFAEIFSGAKKVVSRDRQEGDIVTSIEPSTEQYLESVLSGINEKYSAKRAGGIIMDPSTGRVVAMAINPTFNPNEFSAVTDPHLFINSLVESVYEMGSIIKPLTMAAGIDANVVTATTTYYDAGFLTLNGKTISNYDGKGRGRVDMQQVLSQSLNTGAGTVALKLGAERFRSYFKKFGLGAETGIDLPGEAQGLVRNLESNRDIELVTASYGQGIALTPIQTVRALSVLGNGGYLVTPHVVDKVNYSLGVSRAIGATDKVQVIKKETSTEVTRMLVEVVDEALLGGEYKMPRHSIAAKTGTALIANPAGGGYYTDRYLHSFFGYFPAYEPRFIVFLYVVEPQGVAYASHTLTVPFMDLATYLINYYEIPPDR
ncbi:MAG: hypothetical protein COV91_00385 [Candidatus Taylorbacteria bacterium CG11_big_fil_rev_8_21_14_0_20_46_11]|uniref:Uncharacterized protein n=1 Tax=Candidatus Taylorbacteria bacterium CG11_big_fil_rev_8_21_14_0_20_46_11 TaxID=1975025 RepID=A0A2H0KCZ8_9BACT|nr:MAG: hypothetical protein COV91_00385 [Candidatus Taylorbacteria bacterium CG11_big_fil_rev_8_21_14_0_20_46_11]